MHVCGMWGPEVNLRCHSQEFVFKTENLNGLKLTKQARLAGSRLHLPNAGITSMCHGTGDMVESISLMDWAYNQNVRMFGKRQNPVHYLGEGI